VCSVPLTFVTAIFSLCSIAAGLHPSPQGKLLDLKGIGMDAERERGETAVGGANNDKKARN